MSITEQVISEHLVSGSIKPGDEVAIKIDQTLTQDATGTLTYLELEALNINQVKTLAVSYVDHNTLQTNYRNADDHIYLRTIASNYGIYFSKAGNGICHQIHLERFAVPGKTLLGSDSHTPTAGGIGMLAIGSGGLDVAVSMAGYPFYFKMPEIVGIKLIGKLNPWVSAKDIILELLRRLTVKGGVGKIFEYFGPGVKTLSVYERATITNMGAELGLTSSIFPSDEITLQFLKSQGRSEDWKELKAKDHYEQVIEINLNELKPLIARPHSPDNVVKVKDVEKNVDQVVIGSCTNSSYKDLAVVAEILKKRKLANVELAIVPGSKQTLKMLIKSGALYYLVKAGARILEPACGPCIGMGLSPKTNGISLRTFNRNFKGRCGTKSAKVYLCSSETACASAIYGKITDPRKLGKYPEISYPDFEPLEIEIPKPESIKRGPNIKPVPVRGELEDTLDGKVLIKLGDNVSTDEILPGGAEILPLRSNIPKISEYVFRNIDPNFVNLVKSEKGGFIVAGENYGQGSSREHAAITLMYLGIKAVIAKSYARIHKKNLINFGILPIEFVNPEDYGLVNKNDVLEIPNLRKNLIKNNLFIYNKTINTKIEVKHDLSLRLQKILIAGGLLNYVKTKI